MSRHTFQAAIDLPSADLHKHSNTLVPPSTTENSSLAKFIIGLSPFSTNFTALGLGAAAVSAGLAASGVGVVVVLAGMAVVYFYETEIETWVHHCCFSNDYRQSRLTEAETVEKIRSQIRRFMSIMAKFDLHRERLGFGWMWGSKEDGLFRLLMSDFRVLTLSSVFRTQGLKANYYGGTAYTFDEVVINLADYLDQDLNPLPAPPGKRIVSKASNSFSIGAWVTLNISASQKPYQRSTVTNRITRFTG